MLDRIVATKREEVAALAPAAAELRDRCRDLPRTRGFAAALRHPERVQLLAEVKRRSPSAGAIQPDADAASIAMEYEAGGAAAISVLTDGEFFAGSLADLESVRGSVGVPLLRKDFIVDPLQLWEARAAGADGVLLIVRILRDSELRELREQAEDLGMDALVEAHDEGEIERAIGCGAGVLGVNNRDLATFRTDLDFALRVARRVPPELILVAESGICDAADVDRLGAVGVDGILVGESLMRQPDVRLAARRLAGRRKSERRG
ncbi:MAG: indole-3-glycerol phosphate synthase TrpC [Gemmatimonadota bacterium]|nr:indole-3-glycerol phosphate synthase TrpC [Gemmatimonadota bacterium]